MERLIDTHAHLTCDRLFPRIEEIIEEAKLVGFHKILVVCTTVIEFERALSYQEKEPMIDIAFGFHPGDVHTVTEEDFKVLENAIKKQQIIAIGEIGLDYHYDKTLSEIQQQLFIRQIEMANQHNLPIIIHMREATQDTLTILKEYSTTTFLMHCFSGSVETAQLVLKMGGYLSFAGPITFKNARGLVDVVPHIPIHRIFVESDAPYLTPHPFRGKENEPKYVIHTFDKVVELMKMDPCVLEEQMDRNYSELFELKKSI